MNPVFPRMTGYQPDNEASSFDDMLEIFEQLDPTAIFNAQ